VLALTSQGHRSYRGISAICERSAVTVENSESKLVGGLWKISENKKAYNLKP